LLLANSKHYNSCSGLAPYSVMNMPDTPKKPLYLLKRLIKNQHIFYRRR